jgi:hypothetical protein
VVTLLAVPHPLTGELIDRSDFAAIAEAEKAADEYLRLEYARLRKIRRALDLCRGRMAELNGPYRDSLKPRQRTPTQQQVHDCPRCSHKPSSVAG